MLWTFQRVMQGQTTITQAVVDVTAHEAVALAPLLVLIFVLGIAPNLILTPAAGSTAALVADLPAKVWLALIR